MCISFTVNLPAVIILDFLVMGWSVHNRRMSEFLERLMLFLQNSERAYINWHQWKWNCYQIYIQFEEFPIFLQYHFYEIADKQS